MGRGFACVGLWHPKSALNVGAALRAADCYRASMVAVKLRHPGQAIGMQKLPNDTTKAWRRLPLVLTGDDITAVVPVGCDVVAVERTERGVKLPRFQHPQQAFYLFGPEDGSLPKDLLDYARHVVSVDTRNCMNLAATVNVVLYDRAAKEVE